LNPSNKRRLPEDNSLKRRDLLTLFNQRVKSVAEDILPAILSIEIFNFSILTKYSFVWFLIPFSLCFCWHSSNFCAFCLNALLWQGCHKSLSRFVPENLCRLDDGKD
jgi:hypothetical protein